MTTPADSIYGQAHVLVILADYISVDASGKLTAVGAGFTISGLQESGLTAPQHLGIIVSVPSRQAGREFALSASLRDEDTQQVVMVPGPSGEPQALRIAQLVKAPVPAASGVYLPDSVCATTQIVLAFQNGLPLTVGRNYAWHVDVDGSSRNGWSARFYVPGPHPAPVIGGPAGPASLKISGAQ